MGPRALHSADGARRLDGRDCCQPIGKPCRGRVASASFRRWACRQGEWQQEGASLHVRCSWPGRRGSRELRDRQLWLRWWGDRTLMSAADSDLLFARSSGTLLHARSATRRPSPQRWRGAQHECQPIRGRHALPPTIPRLFPKTETDL